jgi:hypothetical protein
MFIGGWKTAPMFRRYAIISRSDQKAAVEKLEQQRRENSRQATLENSRELAMTRPLTPKWKPRP